MDRGAELNSDLFKGTFVLFDLAIDLLFTTPLTILVDESAVATPTSGNIRPTGLTKRE